MRLSGGENGRSVCFAAKVLACSRAIFTGLLGSLRAASNTYSRTSATVHHLDEFTAAARDNPVHLRGQMLAVGGPVPIGHRGFEIDLEVISRLGDIT